MKYTSHALEKILVAHEGVRKYAYHDTLGNLTIGVGRTLDGSGEGLNADEILLMLQNDIDKCQKQLSSYDWFKSQNEVRQDALIELCFNMGLNGLLKFEKMIAALSVNDFTEASQELLDSKWTEQVGYVRSRNIAKRISSGIAP